MSIPPWIRSPIDPSVAAARLETQAAAHSKSPTVGGQNAAPEISSVDPMPHRDAPPDDDLESFAPTPETPTPSADDLDTVVHPDAGLIASPRHRARRRDDDDHTVEQPAPEQESSTSTRSKELQGLVHAGPFATASALVGLVACIAAGFALGGGFTAGPTTGTTEVSEVEAQSAQVPIDDPVGGCEHEEGEDFFRGNGPGDRLSPVGIVAAFEHAYYVETNAARAVELTAPEAGIDRTRLHDQGIAMLPEGTTHCVDARQTGDDVVSAQITEFRPGAEPIVINQKIHTGLNDDGIYAITKIEHTEAPA